MTGRGAALAAVALVALQSAPGCATVPAGWGGVLVERDGLQSQPLTEGAHTEAPWSLVELYDLRAQVHDEDFAALSADGAPIEARASVLTFHIVPAELVDLARSVGPEYYARVVQPIVQSTVRRVLAAYRADALDTPGVLRAQAEILALAAERLRPYHLQLDSLVLRRVEVPTNTLAYAAILATAEVEQAVQAIPSRLELARRRADAAREAARGIAASQREIGPTLSAGVLVDAAERAWSALARAPTTTVVVSGAGQPTLLEVSP